MRRLIYDGDSVYELDEECLRKKEKTKKKNHSSGGGDRETSPSAKRSGAK